MSTVTRMKCKKRVVLMNKPIKLMNQIIIILINQVLRQAIKLVVAIRASLHLKKMYKNLGIKLVVKYKLAMLINSLNMILIVERVVKKILICH